ncbi:HAD family phosphatase [Patescibacteria group bacterium]|nr:HAD family phosphatase [Patescibacteria group bacterium]MCH8889230.1 HAD family phosphatase [Patescibacteria group bacterium]
MLRRPIHRQKVAIFDIDGTIGRGSLLIYLLDGLINASLISEVARKEFKHDHKKWLDRKGLYDEYIRAVTRTFMKHIKGVHYGDFVEIAKKSVLAHKDHVYLYTKDLIASLKKDGYYLLAISQSPKTIVDFFCENLGFDKVYGRIYEIGPQDRFTGEMVDVHLISNKANIVRRAVQKENLTLKESVGVGDTEDDIPFLEMVETPICFNPNKKLHKHAVRMGWKIIVERKNMIYEIK